MDSASDPIWERAKFLADRPCSVRSIMILILLDLDAQMGNTGSAHLIHAVQEAVDADQIHIVTSELFETVRQKYDPGASFESIDFAIRTLFRTAWKNRQEEVWKRYFPTRIVYGRKPPGNVDAIGALVSFVYLCQDLCGMEAVCHGSK